MYFRNKSGESSDEDEGSENKKLKGQLNSELTKLLVLYLIPVMMWIKRVICFHFALQRNKLTFFTLLCRCNCCGKTQCKMDRYRWSGSSKRSPQRSSYSANQIPSSFHWKTNTMEGYSPLWGKLTDICRSIRLGDDDGNETEYMIIA